MSHLSVLFIRRSFSTAAYKMKALIPIAHGSEEIEATTIANILTRAGVAVQLASVHPEKTIKGSRGISIVADKLIDECKETKFDLIALPGGLPGAEHLRDCPTLIEMLKTQRDAGRWYSAICASPAVVLETHGLIGKRKATCYPGFKLADEHVVEDEKKRTVVSENLVTSKGPGTAMEFALELVRVLKGDGEAQKVASGLLYTFV